MLRLNHLAILAFSAIVWVMQFALALIGLSRAFNSYGDWPWMLKMALATDLLVGFAIATLLIRALFMSPRSKAQLADAIRRERRHIARELHDQVGSQIVNAMMLLDAKDVRARPVMQTLEQCMLDLRLIVDVMSDHSGNLAEKLGTLRHRLQPVLDRRGISLTWIMEAEPAEHLPTGVRARELCRMVQEAVSNALQHSQATQLTITLRPLDTQAPGSWLLSVHDNGVGMRGTARIGYVGRGLANMKRRALRAGGELSIHSQPSHGTQIIVVINATDFAATVQTAD